MTATNPLVGTWRCTGFVVRAVATGAETLPFGPDPLGYMTYTSEGYMSAFVTTRDRAAPIGAAIRDEEKIALFDTMLSYVGTYSSDADTITHHIAASWNQSWTGTDAIRHFRLDGDLLTIDARVLSPRTGEEIETTVSLVRAM